MLQLYTLPRTTDTHTSIWRGRFRTFWAGQSISEIGSGISLFAMPTIAVLVLHGDPVQLSLLGVVQYLPFPVCSIPLGVLVDRRDRRLLMLAADLTRMVLLGVLAGVTFTGHLSWVLLYASAFAVSTLTALFEIAYQAYLPSLLPPERWPAANAAVTATRSVGHVGGPGLSGILIARAGAGATLACDAVSYVASAATVACLPSDRAHASQEKPGAFRRSLVSGLTFAARDRRLRRIALCSFVLNAGFQIAQSCYFLYAYHSLHVTPGDLGLVLSVSAIGGLVGAWIGGNIGRRVAPLAALRTSAALAGVSWFILPLGSFATPLVRLFASSSLIYISLAVYDVSQLSVRQSVTPAALLGQVTASLRAVTWTAIPVGMFIGGAVGQLAGTRDAILVGGCVAVVAPAALTRGFERPSGVLNV